MQRHIYKSIIFSYILPLVLMMALGGDVFAQGRRSTPFLFSQDLSSPYVTSFAEDKDGFIWIGTNHGLNRYNGTFYDVHYTYSYDECLNNDNIQQLLVDEAGDVWMLTEAGLAVRRNNRFYKYGQSGFMPIFQLVDDNDHILIADTRGVDKIKKEDLSLAYHYKSLKIGIPKPIGVAENGCILMTREITGTDQIVILDEQLREIGTLNFDKPTVVSKILKDSDGSNWVVTSKALYHVTSKDILDPKESRSTQVSLSLENPLYELDADSKLLFICDYDAEHLLLGYQGSGLILLDKSSARETPIHKSEKLLVDKCVCFVDSYRNIWMSEGLSGFKLLSTEMEYEHLAFADSNDANFKKLCFDAQNRLWLRSSSDLICYSPEKNKYHAFTQPSTFYGDIFIDSRNRLWTIEQYSHLKCYEISDNPQNEVGAKLLISKHYDLKESAFSLSEDTNGRIWASLSDRFAVIDPDGTLNYEEGPFKVNFSSMQSQNTDGRMFLYSVGKGIYEYMSEGRFQQLGAQIPGTRIVYADGRKNLWIGSSNKGLVRYNEQTKESDYIQDRMEMGAYDIKAIEEDVIGNIWFSTSTMLFRYNQQDSTVVSIHDDNLRNGTVYNLYASAKDRMGRLYFGGMSGVTVVDPVGMKYQKKVIPIKVEDIVINGSNLFEYDGKPFELKYYDNNIVFWFSGLDFSLGKQLSYEYMLEGYEKYWQPVGHQTRLAYNDLPAGKYNLKIRVKSLYGSGIIGECTMPFTITEAPWLTIWAKLAYIIILLSLLYIGFRHLIRWRLREERYALLEQREAVNSQFVRFVTNISHEFRTPLSMMYAPLVEFLSNKKFDGRDKDLMDMIMRNTEKLRTLTETVLDAGKGKYKEKKLNICQQNIVPFLKVVFDNFHYLAAEKNISMEFVTPDEVKCPIDNEKVERIVGNLLSNALKYTPNDGLVKLCIESVGDKVAVSVIDNGPGVPEEAAKRLFQKYDRIDMETRNPEIMGTGIGLYYSDYLAHLHKGELSYEPNKPNGSKFSLTLPADVSAYTPDQIISEDKVFQTLNGVSDDNAEKKEAAGTLFIVEDNPDVSHFLQLCLGQKYNLFTAVNGAEALDNLATCVPDLIISDVMMPVMDGHELCRKLKESSTYGHIPIILLTALDDNQKAVEYIKSGADAYVQKPFDPRKLAAMVDTMIANRRKVQNMVSSLTSSAFVEQKSDETSNADIDMLSIADKNFLANFYAQLDEHLADENYGIDEMGKALGIGEAKLYAKVKTLTGQTPKAFFVTYRMNKAMELLKSGQYTVSEVGYMVGSTSPAVFSRSFKHQFGISPSAIEQ